MIKVMGWDVRYSDQMNSESGNGFGSYMAHHELSGMLSKASTDADAVDAQAAGNWRAGSGPSVVEGEAARLEKVARTRAAVCAGTYVVPVQAMARKMLDAMLAVEQKRAWKDRRKRPRVGHRGLMGGHAKT